MKIIITLILVLSSFIINTQELSSDIKYALKKDDSTALKKLLTSNNLNTCFNAGNSKYTFLNLTIKLNSEACFELLLKEKVDVNKECNGKTPLMYAAKYGHLKIAKLLIKEGADTQKKYKGRTALAYASKYNKDAVYTYLKSL
jgi:ankyrin repeat protein